MKDIESIIIIIVFMISLSFVLNFIGSTLIDIMHSIFHKQGQRKHRFNNIKNPQYDISEDDNDLDTSEIPVQSNSRASLE